MRDEQVRALTRLVSSHILEVLEDTPTRIAASALCHVLGICIVSQHDDHPMAKDEVLRLIEENVEYLSKFEES